MNSCTQSIIVLIENEGTQIVVVGQTNPGQSPLITNYTIDDGIPAARSEVGVDSQDAILSETLFASSQFAYGSHKLTIDVLSTWGDRDYVLWYFAIFNGTGTNGTASETTISTTTPLPSSTSQTDDAGTGDSHHTSRTVAIAAGVLGGLLFVAVVLLGLLLYKRKIQRTKGMFHMSYRFIISNVSS